MGDGMPRLFEREDLRRAGPRRKVRVDICLFDEFGEPVAMETEDLGPAGVFVRSDLVYDPGEELFVSLQVMGGPAFVVRGRVVRAQLGEGGRPAGMGIAFLDLTPRQEVWLRWFAGEQDGQPPDGPVLVEAYPSAGAHVQHMLP